MSHLSCLMFLTCCLYCRCEKWSEASQPSRTMRRIFLYTRRMHTLLARYVWVLLSISFMHIILILQKILWCMQIYYVHTYNVNSCYCELCKHFSPPQTPTPPPPKSPTPPPTPPPPPTPLPEYIAQFIGRPWFDKLYPNANSSVSC